MEFKKKLSLFTQQGMSIQFLSELGKVGAVGNTN